MVTMHKAPLRDPLRTQLLADIIAGRLEPGVRLGIVELAGRYGVSATPVREALTQLAHEGAVVAEPNRGFFVPQLSLQEAADVYPLLGSLEGMALQTAASATARDLEQLRDLNRALFGASTVQQRINADSRWHRRLVAACRNQMLIQILDTLRGRAERYERAFMRASDEVVTSCAEHDDLIRLLGEGEAVEAARRLRTHWMRSLSFIERYIAARDRPEEVPVVS